MSVNDPGGPSCVSCGAALAGAWCHACGEARAEGVPSLGAFLRSAVRELTSLEGRGFRTFRALLEQPGLLTREYLIGRHRPWLSPLQCFLITNLIFFISLSFIGGSGLTTPLRSQLEDQGYSELARNALRARFAGQETVDFEVFEARFDYATVQQSKALVILLVPMFAVALWLTRPWRREPPVQHLVFALHYISVLMLLFVVTSFLMRILILAAVLVEVGTGVPGTVARVGSYLGETFYTLAMLSGLGSYLFLSLRRAGGDRRLPAALRAAGLAVSTVLLIILYRMILFFTVLSTV